MEEHPLFLTARHLIPVGALLLPRSLWFFWNLNRGASSPLPEAGMWVKLNKSYPQVGGICMNRLEEEGASEILAHRIHASLKLFEDRFFHHRTETEGKINREETGYPQKWGKSTEKLTRNLLQTRSTSPFLAMWSFVIFLQRRLSKLYNLQGHTKPTSTPGRDSFKYQWSTNHHP